MRSSYKPPTVPPMKARPPAIARQRKGKTSAEMDWTMLIEASAGPTKIPPPINMVIEVDFAATIEPTAAIIGGMTASHLRPNSSEIRPKMGDSTLWISSGPYTRLSNLWAIERHEGYLNNPAGDAGLSYVSDDEGYICPRCHSCVNLWNQSITESEDA